MTYHPRTKTEMERRHIIALKKLLSFLESKPNKEGLVVAEIKALYWAINNLEQL